MAATASPLRYPGGKTCLTDLAVQLLKLNKLERGHYAEPYAGGCGLALGLLFGGFVSDIHINDVDAGIWSFWHSCLYETAELCELIQQTPVDMDEWHKQREIVKTNGDGHSALELGFATFFLNRTNRSGIIQTAGVIGGLDQTGNYKIDCRFNKPDLIRRIKRIAKYQSQIHLSQLDAIDFMATAENLPEDTFFCIDPPYYNKGSSLYTSFYNPDDHASVASAVLELPCPWVVTYDNSDAIKRLYKKRRQFNFDIKYSVQTKRMGTELLIASKGLKLPQEIRWRQVNRVQYRAA